MTKGEFIVKFLESVKGVASTINSLMIYESMQRKDLRMGGFDPDKIYSGFKNLERRGIISKAEGNNYKFTQKGKKWHKNVSIKYFSSKNKKWDGKWRVVIFDIPQELHKNRNNLRHKLRYLGFYMLQKSVFVLPYPCEEELGYICQNLGISDYIDVIIADSMGFREEEIKKHFEI